MADANPKPLRGRAAIEARQAATKADVEAREAEQARLVEERALARRGRAAALEQQTDHSPQRGAAEGSAAGVSAASSGSHAASHIARTAASPPATSAPQAGLIDDQGRPLRGRAAAQRLAEMGQAEAGAGGAAGPKPTPQRAEATSSSPGATFERAADDYAAKRQAAQNLEGPLHKQFLQLQKKFVELEVSRQLYSKDPTLYGNMAKAIDSLAVQIRGESLDSEVEFALAELSTGIASSDWMTRDATGHHERPGAAAQGGGAYSFGRRCPLLDEEREDLKSKRAEVRRAQEAVLRKFEIAGIDTSNLTSGAASPSTQALSIPPLLLDASAGRSHVEQKHLSHSPSRVPQDVCSAPSTRLLPGERTLRSPRSLQSSPWDVNALGGSSAYPASAGPSWLQVAKAEAESPLFMSQAGDNVRRHRVGGLG
eukprot:TRINITY_DN20290_c0_g1_i3.p1 TRINITY_DN20290_c0_g1~~TRINITY_DN20290_c0_g1_i3.p1  ORF type:complete len:452 (-),score=63.77 TRINITY_DN20290_c0_g1_i3:378-1655(-)